MCIVHIYNTMTTPQSEFIRKTLRVMLRPIITFCLRNGLGVQELTETVKQVLVQTATESITASGEKANVSRLSVATGIHRRDILRLMSSESTREIPVNLISRVLAQWENDQRFQTKQGHARNLRWEGDESEFCALVRSVSSDVHPGTILFQLEQRKLVEKTPSGLKLSDAAQIVRDDLGKSYHILAQDIEDLTQTVEENLSTSTKLPHLHARTEYDNLFVDDLPTIQEWLLREGSALHQRARAFLSQFDQDLNPHIRKKAGGKIALGTFSRMIYPQSTISPRKELV